MGMDVMGKDPSNENGEYYRANIWAWATLQSLLISAGCEEAKKWSSNDGRGLNTQKACDVLADQLEHYIKTHPEARYSMPVKGQSPIAEGVIRLLGAESLGTNPKGEFGKGNISPYYIEVGDVREFITFLRSCGGFEIY